MEYKPKCYIEKVNDGSLALIDKKDEFTLLEIKAFYGLIKQIEGDLNLNNRSFCFKHSYSYSDGDEIAKLLKRIPNCDVNKYAKIKLTDEERKFAYDFMKKCTKENSIEMMEYAENYSNFFIGSYMKDLLLHHPESDYFSSTRNIYKHVERCNKEFNAAFKRIRIREQQCRITAKNRIVG